MHTIKTLEDVREHFAYDTQLFSINVQAIVRQPKSSWAAGHKILQKLPPMDRARVFFKLFEEFYSKLASATLSATVDRTYLAAIPGDCRRMITDHFQGKAQVVGDDGSRMDKTLFMGVMHSYSGQPALIMSRRGRFLNCTWAHCGVHLNTAGPYALFKSHEYSFYFWYDPKIRHNLTEQVGEFGNGYCVFTEVDAALSPALAEFVRIAENCKF